MSTTHHLGVVFDFTLPTPIHPLGVPPPATLAALHRCFAGAHADSLFLPENSNASRASADGAFLWQKSGGRGVCASSHLRVIRVPVAISSLKCNTG